MIFQNGFIAALAVGATLAVGSAASAAEAVATAQEQRVIYGAPIAGFCTFSFNQVIGQSKVGQAVTARLKLLDAAWRAELQPQADAINTDKRALDAEASTLDRATLDARTANLQLRVSNLESLANQRQRARCRLRWRSKSA